MKHLGIKIIVTMVLLLASLAYAQNCDSIVQDEAGIVNNTSAVEQGAKSLINQGADVHVITVADMYKYGSNLQAVETAYEAKCPSWKSPAGVRKANLFTLVVAVNQRKKNAFIGGAYSPAFSENDLTTIYSKYANSYFANKQWSEGFGAAFKGMGTKLEVYNDAKAHPAPIVTNNNVQATDLKPVESGFKWLLFIMFIVAAGLGLVWWWSTKKDKEDARSLAQQRAVYSRHRATTAYLNLANTTPGYAEISQLYQELSSTLSSDPSANDLDVSTYEAINDQWTSLLDSIRKADPAAQRWRSTSSDTEKATPSVSSTRRHSSGSHSHSPAPASTPSAPSHSSTNVFINNETISEDRPSRSYHSSSDSDSGSSSSSRSSSSSSSSSSGSDSSWGSSDSGSSSYDSGSSSSSDSGSSGGGDSSF